MDPLEVKARLERALHREIAWPEWRHLQRTDVVGEYLRNPLECTEEENWREFRDSAKRQLDFLRSFRDDEAREQAGDIRGDYEYGGGYQADSPADPEDRVSARLGAIGALNMLHSDDSAPSRSAMSSTLLPRGGVDGTLPQWVYVTAVEMWMPAEKVMEAYRWMQQTMMVEPDPPKTQPRAFNVARFVWEQERQYGERPPWPVMCERWNNYPLTRPFKSWRDFRTYFFRGAKATPPRYIATDEQLTDVVRREAGNGARVFHSWAGQVLAATVHQPCINPSE